MKPKNLHFMGIAGSGTSACAAIVKAQGFTVSGCDLNLESEYIAPLKKEKTPLFSGHSPKHLKNVDLLVISPAIESLDPRNQEILEAKKRKIPVLTWEKFMGGVLQKDKFVIAIAGTHGKSTTTAMIGLILEAAGFDPTVELGAQVKEWSGKNFRVGKSKYFVCEADEYNDNFLNYHPDIAVVTNIEYDHPEDFKNFGQMIQSFRRFVSNLKEGGRLILEQSANYRIKFFYKDKWPKWFKRKNYAFAISPEKTNILPLPPRGTKLFDLSPFKLKIPGQFNQQNAILAYEVALSLGINSEIIRRVLENFTGISRRFDMVGEINGVKIYNDYGHHPTALKVTIEAAREKFSQEKIWVVFQPHMFIRTKVLFADFVKVFKNAPVEKIVLTDIFPSREKDTGLVHSRDLVEAVGKENVVYGGNLTETADYLRKNLLDFDVLLNFGAGDNYKISKMLLE